jgi:hypothetical protein
MAESFSQYRILSQTNTCYKVLHLTEEKNQSRVKCAEKIRATLNLDELESPTILIDGIDSLKKFLSEYPLFNVDPNGYDPMHSRNSPEYDKEKATPVGWIYQELGIWASNYLAYKDFLNSDYEYLMLFEDDVVINANFLELVDSYMRELPEDWDVFYPYSPEPPLFYGEVISDHLCRPYTTWSNAAYMVSKKGVKKLIDSVETEAIYMPIDWHILKQQDKYSIFTIQVGFDKGCYLSGTPSTYWSYKGGQYKSLKGLI